MVNVEEIKQVMQDVILPIFNAETSNLFVTCTPIMEKKLNEGFGDLGFKAEVKPLTFFQDDYGLKAGEGMDGDVDGDEEEDSDIEMEETEDEAVSGENEEEETEDDVDDVESQDNIEDDT